MIKEEIKKVLEKIIGADNLQVDFVSEEQFGDYSSNVAMTTFGSNKLQTTKTKWKTPREYAQEIITRLLKEEVIKKYFDKVEIAGPGFINFWLKKDILIDNLIQISKQKEDFGKSEIGKGKTVVIDYSSPNIAKPFGVGHLRSTVIGQALYNLYKYLGYNVIGDNHLGDWGTQFGKLLYMIDLKKTSDLSIENLEKMYVEFHELSKDPKVAEEMESGARAWFKKLEDNDLVARTLWKQCVNISLNEFQRIYDLLGVKIDNAYGESFYEDEMKNLQQKDIVNRNLFHGGDGAWMIDLTLHGIKTPLMFLKSDGATTYATRDLATLQFRQNKFKPSVVIYEVGVEQKLHFEQVFASAKLLKLIDNDCELIHTAHGLYLAPDGKKFSTRKGKTIKLEEVLLEAIERAKKLGNSDNKTSKQVGIGAIKYFDLMHGVQSNVIFDWDKMLTMEGNSGPYIQYTFARTQSLISKIEKLKKTNSSNNLNNEELLILRKLSQFQEIIVDAAKSYSPNTLCSYLYDLASKFNTLYNKHKIIGSESEDFRILLTFGAGQVLKNGLNLLGIEAPKRM